jgi:hypothetical protein
MPVTVANQRAWDHPISGYIQVVNSAVVPANAGTHNHSRK